MIYKVFQTFKKVKESDKNFESVLEQEVRSGRFLPEYPKYSLFCIPRLRFVQIEEQVQKKLTGSSSAQIHQSTVLKLEQVFGLCTKTKSY